MLKKQKRKATAAPKKPTPLARGSSKTSTAVVPRKSQPPAVNSKLFEQDSHSGLEGATAQDYAIPRLAILQDLSPQCKKTEAGYIKDAEPGDICDIVSGTLYSGEDGIVVIPVSYRRAHLEWVPRTKGGGFVADHGSDGKIVEQCQRGEKGELILKNGNIIKITAEYYLLLVDEKTGDSTAFVLSMTGTQMKKARRWNTIMNQLRVPKDGGGTFNPAMFYRAYKLTTVPERNDQGSWFGWAITPDEFTIKLPQGEETYIAAREFQASVRSGAVRATPPMAHEPESEEAETSPM